MKLAGGNLLRNVTVRVSPYLRGDLRRRLTNWAHGAAGPRRCEVVGVPLMVQGLSVGQPDQDDAWLVGLISESDAFIDIGCNVGYFSLIACVLRPSGRVLAIDANADCAAVTAANLVRNGFGDRAQTTAAFVGATAGAVTFHTVGVGAAGSSLESMATLAHTIGRETLVEGDTLDAIVARTGFAPDLIKVDVEGAERDVLAGAVHTVEEHRPRLLVEMHSAPELPMVRNATDVLAWAAERGYAAWYLSAGEQIAGAEAIADRGRCHLLLLPEGEPLPPVIAGIPQGAPISAVLDRLGRANA